MDKEQARQEIEKLVERFRETADRSRFNEAQTRHYFVLPLFRALGWNTEDPAEMSAEEQISRGFVDFGFYLNGVPAFYLETKKIHSDLERSEWAKQAMNYSWLRGVTWAALTDFEGMKVFNAEWQERDPHKALFLDLKWEDYADKGFDDLWLLSKAALQSGEMNQIAERYGKKARKKPVNELLFAQLTTWRRDLFKEMRTYGNLFKENTQLVDDAVQRLLDRLIFIRTVEDRGVESPRLQAIVRQFKENRKKDKNLFQDLLALFRELNAVYNAELFAQSSLDLLEIHDWKLLENIINGLYTAPGGYDRYDFNAINADVLGSMYEQYLSFKAADPTAKDAIDPHKQTKRKSQGIYYTPQFVVRYIVQQTLGKLLAEGADPYRIRVLDPACGSGSFLIEAFDVLDRHLAQHGMEDHRVHPRKRRLHILQHNLYGVDLDPQAVEVARLNLLLRAANERGLLPMLHHLKVGNSLIDDPDVAGEHAFDWQREFLEVMQDGGFDVVIGNPPYVRIGTLVDIDQEGTKYIKQKYESAGFGKIDIYAPFVERAHTLLKASGVMGFIIPNKFIHADYGIGLRNYIVRNKAPYEIVDFGERQVFENATTYTCLLFLAGFPQEAYVLKHNTNLPSPVDILSTKGEMSSVSSLTSDTWKLIGDTKNTIIEKIEACGTLLPEYLEQMITGVKTGANDVFVFDFVSQHDDYYTLRSSENSLNVTLEADLVRPYLKADSFKRYEVRAGKRCLLYPYLLVDNRTQLIPETVLKSEYPNIYQYLEKHRQVLDNRQKGKLKGENWYGLSFSSSILMFESNRKLVTPTLSPFNAFTLDLGKNFFPQGSGGGCGLIVKDDCSIHYLLGTLNSKLLTFYFQKISSVFRGGWYAYEPRFLEKLPIRKINFDDPADVESHDRMVALVEEMLHLKREHVAAEAAFDDRRHALAHRIAQVDREIDTLVYGLYGLTPEEIRIVEGE